MKIFAGDYVDDASSDVQVVFVIGVKVVGGIVGVDVGVGGLPIGHSLLIAAQRQQSIYVDEPAHLLSVGLRRPFISANSGRRKPRASKSWLAGYSDHNLPKRTPTLGVRVRVSLQGLGYLGLHT